MGSGGRGRGGAGFKGTGGHRVNAVINQGRQDKHIEGTSNYNHLIKQGNNPSRLTANPNQLLKKYAGTGTPTGLNKERISTDGEIIGQYYHHTTGKYYYTTNCIIHYDSKGNAHIVPAAPDNFKK